MQYTWRDSTPSISALFEQVNGATEGQQGGTSGPILSDELIEILQLCRQMNGDQMAALLEIGRQIVNSPVAKST